MESTWSGYVSHIHTFYYFLLSISHDLHKKHKSCVLVMIKYIYIPQVNFSYFSKIHIVDYFYFLFHVHICKNKKYWFKIKFEGVNYLTKILWELCSVIFMSQVSIFFFKIFLNFLVFIYLQSSWVGELNLNTEMKNHI